MRKWMILFGMIAFCSALTPIYNQHDDTEKVDDEFSNLFLNVQPVQFTIRNTTPNVADMQEGQIVIFSSGGVTRLMLLQGATVYQVTVSSLGGTK